MRRSEKRFRSFRDDSDKRNQKRRRENDNVRGEKGNDELVVYRILCPDSVIGSVIGKNGNVINTIRQDSRAKVKVVDPFTSAKDRVIIVYCYIRDKEEIDVDDEFNDVKPLCPAQDALLKVHAAIANAVAVSRESDRRRRDKDIEECHLLVPSSQAANIIGKSGATIKKVRNKTRTSIKITAKDAGEPTHSCALEFDNFVLISGESEAVKKAIFAISAIMYKFSPKENIPLDTSIREAPPSIIIPSDVPLYPASGLYQGVDPLSSARPLPSISGSTRITDIPSYADAGSSWSAYSNALPVISGYGGPQSQVLTIKVICPSNKIGRVIGKGGMSIKSIRQESGASVEVEEADSNHSERLISVVSTESQDDLKSMGVEAVLLLQGKINEEDDENVTFRLLVPSKVIGCIIGKSGSIINEIRKRTRANIRISKSEKPLFADERDELVEISGEIGCVRDAIIQIVLRLREDILKDREESRDLPAEKLHSGSSYPVRSVFRPHSAAPTNEPRPDIASALRLVPTSGYGYGSLPVRDHDYGSLSLSSSLYAGLPPSILEIVIPAHAVGKVMGKGGTNIDNICKISGASIEISDSKLSRGDHVALISGTGEQKRTAENLIQAFIMAT